jgi:hypothetical protein
MVFEDGAQTMPHHLVIIGDQNPDRSFHDFLLL